MGAGGGGQTPLLTQRREEKADGTNVEALVPNLHDLANLTLGANLLELGGEGLGVVGKLHGEALLERDREGDQEVAGGVLVDPGLDLGQPLVLLADVVALREVDQVRDGLGREEHEVVDDVDLPGHVFASVTRQW